MYLFQRIIFRTKLEFAISYFTAINLLMTSIVVLMTLVHRKTVYSCTSQMCMSQDQIQQIVRSNMVNPLRNMNPDNCIFFLILLSDLSV